MVDGRVQRARLAQESDDQRVQADRRATQAAARLDPQPRERREGGDGLREVHARGRDPGAQPGAPGRRRRSRCDQADQPGRERSLVRPAAAHGGGGTISPAQGDGERRAAPGGADFDREPDRVRPPALQRHGDPVQHQTTAVPDEPGRGDREDAARRPVGGGRPSGEGGAAGRSLAEAQGVSDPTALNLFQQQEANRRRTALLVIGFVVFFAWLGFGGDYIYRLYTADAPRAAYHHTFPWFGIVLSLVAVAIASYAYRTGPERVLWATGAREVVDPATDR